MRYSLRRASSLDFVDGGTHNPTVGDHQERFNHLKLLTQRSLRAWVDIAACWIPVRSQTLPVNFLLVRVRVCHRSRGQPTIPAPRSHTSSSPSSLQRGISESCLQ